ncbi:MAG: aminodeoxychorismate synthase component I [Gemmataceae bacterium]|nr:aminodeoxychorismate synthase component I [Gemmataceae bacterium]
MLGKISRTDEATLVEDWTGLTAWEACRRLADLPHLLFLDSARTTGPARYSYVTADPFAWFECAANAVASERPLRCLQTALRKLCLPTLPGLPPFQGGAAGLFGYELGHEMERLPQPAVNDFGVPALAVGLYDWVLAFDQQQRRAWLISTGLPLAEASRRAARAAQRADEVRRRLDRGPAADVGWRREDACPVRTPSYDVPGLAGVASNFSRATYLAAVRRAIDYIHAGDCFQVNFAQRLVTRQRASPLEIYERLRARNPAPFAAYFHLGEFTIASASPERFVRLSGNEVETRPIKGTRPRGYTPEEDLARAEELKASTKDRAENVMIVDLLRNDLGRVCEFGSIRVTALCRLETHPFVHHLVSDICGRLRPELDAIDLLRAAFPGGSVTGAPKIRSMEIIAELEGVARGPYCGCLGFIGFDGSMDTNILIRTLVLGRGWVHFAVGGGIVADSEPDREYAESWHKAEGLLRSLSP